MSDLYLRKVVLDIYPEIGPSIQIDKLRISFDVEKTNESNPNNAEIKIYNLSDKSRSLLEKKNTRVALSIGYVGIPSDSNNFLILESKSTVEVVFIGNIEKVVQEVSGPDIITTIEVKNGGNRFQNPRFDKGYPPNTDLNTVLTDVSSSMGLALGSRVGIENKKFVNGLTLSGMTRDHLNYLTESNGLEWSIQNETVQIIGKENVTADAVVVLDAETGLIGSPSKTKEGVEFTSLVQPLLKPGRKVKIESRFLNGFFKVRIATHQGDSHFGDFLTNCEGTVFNG